MATADLARALVVAIEASDGDTLKVLLAGGSANALPNHGGFASRLQPGKLKKSALDSVASELAAQHQQLTYAVSQQNIDAAWIAINALVNTFFRLISTLSDSRWICSSLIMLLGQHRSLSIAADLLHAESNNAKTEECARQLSKAFSVCVGDRNLTLEYSRKWATYEVVCILFSTYFRLKSLGLCRNILRAVNAADLPPLDQFPRSQRVGFHYYVGVLAFLNEDYAKAETDLTDAFIECHASQTHNQGLILRYLIPCGMLAGRLPRRGIVLRHRSLAALYLPFVDAIRSGNVKAYDDALSVPATEKFLVRSGTYLAIERAREICLRGLIKRVHRCKGKSSRIALSDFHHALRFVGVQVDLLEAEWLVASQIAKGYVKGYISHPHMTAVLSNQEPFPSLANIPLTI